MGAISNLNVVVQQSGTAQEAQQARQSPEQAQLAATQQQAEKENAKRTKVAGTGETEFLRLNKDGSHKKQHKKQTDKNKKSKKEQEQKTLGTPGSLLDTIA